MTKKHSKDSKHSPISVVTQEEQSSNNACETQNQVARVITPQYTIERSSEFDYRQRNSAQSPRAARFFNFRKEEPESAAHKVVEQSGNPSNKKK